MAREDSEGLTFLERLALRVLATRSVPRESGVSFRISTRARKDGVCLVFEVDDKDAPVVSDGLRPDFLVLHLSSAGCILTIVEMKGRDPKKGEHGIDQIVTLAKTLREALSSCLPGPLRRFVVQGVLLMPANAQINVKKIVDASKKDHVEILQVQSHHRAELYEYVSSRISRTKKYGGGTTLEEARDGTDEFNALEAMFARGMQRTRRRDDFFAARRGHAEDTFHLDFVRPGDAKSANVTLSSHERSAVLAFADDAKACREVVEKHLAAVGLMSKALPVRWRNHRVAG